MDSKEERSTSALVKEPGERPKERSIRVPGKAGLYEDPSLGITSYLKERVGDVFDLEEGEDWARIGWNQGDMRSIGNLNWYFVSFPGTLIRDDKEVPIERIGWVATKQRTRKQKKAGKPLLFLSPDGFVRGPPPEKKVAGQQHEFVIAKKPAGVTRTGGRV